MKNITRLERNMPDQTSIRIFFISLGEVFSRREISVVSPCKICSSTSWEDCQKNKYGEIVVPRAAQIRIISFLVKLKVGITACCITSAQFISTEKAEIT